MTFELYETPGDYLGLVVPCASGVYWSNQCGGTYCAHPKTEGIYVPLPASVWQPNVHRDNDPLLDYWVYGSDPEEELAPARKALAELLAKTGLAEFFEPWDFPLYWGEAWVPVTVKADQPERFPGLPFLDQLKGRNAFLTYPNSD
jgi:hypothetical protein